MQKKSTNISFQYFLSDILFPLWILAFYFIFLKKLLPIGINNLFLSRSAKIIVPIVGILSSLFLVIIKSKGLKFSEVFIVKKGKPLLWGDLFVLLLPLTPLMQYILNNLETLSLLSIISVIIFFIFSISLLVIFVPFLFRKIISTRILMLLGLAFTFSLINMANLSHQNKWHEFGSLKIQVPVFLGIFLIAWLFYAAKSRKYFYALVVVFFLTTSITQLSSNKDNRQNDNQIKTENMLFQLTSSRKPVTTPNIYFLIYDAYVVNETMLSYGINNQEQEEYLENLGFKIYPHTYSVGATSIETMSRVLNASTEFYGNRRKGVSGDGVVQNLLKEFGYQSYGIFYSDYFFRGIAPSYDYSVPNYNYNQSALTLLNAIFIGEFKFDINLNEMEHALFLEEKEKVFSENTKTPTFIYMHSPYPSHSQNSGKCLENEKDLFRERLSKANHSMKEDIETILKYQQDAIIIIAGDHGPYLEKTCTDTEGDYEISKISRLDIQDRYGTFLAIKWSTEQFEEYDDIVVLQDIFPAIFSYIFQDVQILESKIQPTSLEPFIISNAKVADGFIEGGIDNGEALFIETR